MILHSDHGQTPVARSRAARGSARCARRPHRRHGLEPGRARSTCCRARESTRRSLARALDGEAAVDVDAAARGRRGGRAARGGGASLPARRAAGWETSGDAAILDQPDALHRSWSALANPNAGELLVSAAPGWEFADLGGRHHAGGGSHGSLVEGDSVVPVLTVGVDAAPTRITDVMPAVLAHFGVEPPAYVRSLERVA